jgi:hypothetical protein
VIHVFHFILGYGWIAHIVRAWFLCGCGTLVWDQLAGNGDCMTISFIGYMLIWPMIWWDRIRYRKFR